MNVFWIYDLPNWLFATLAIGLTVAIGLGGFYATRGWARRVHLVQHSHNEIVASYLSGVSLFYGITLGLLAVGTWQGFTEVDSRVDQEASTVAVLYRLVSNLPEPPRSELQQILRDYTRQVIDITWPQQRRGIIPLGTDRMLNDFETRLARFEPVTESQKTLNAEAYRLFDRLVELRRMRLKSVVAGLPTLLWLVVLIGAVLTVGLTWFFDLKSRRMHFWMTVMFCSFLGLLIYQLAALDNPFRGTISVSSRSFELVYDELMKSGQ